MSSSKIQEDVWELVKHRYLAMPQNYRLSIGSGQPLTREDIIRHINDRDKIGEMIVSSQMNFLKNLTKLTSKISEA